MVTNLINTSLRLCQKLFYPFCLKLMNTPCIISCLNILTISFIHIWQRFVKAMDVSLPCCACLKTGGSRWTVINMLQLSWWACPRPLIASLVIPWLNNWGLMGWLQMLLHSWAVIAVIECSRLDWNLLGKDYHRCASKINPGDTSF